VFFGSSEQAWDPGRGDAAAGQEGRRRRRVDRRPPISLKPPIEPAGRPGHPGQGRGAVGDDTAGFWVGRADRGRIPAAAIQSASSARTLEQGGVLSRGRDRIRWPSSGPTSPEGGSPVQIAGQGPRRGRRTRSIGQLPAQRRQAWAGQGIVADQQPPAPLQQWLQGRRRAAASIAWSAKPAPDRR